MKTVLVAGATGNVGKYFVQVLKERGYVVKVLVRNPEKLRQTKGEDGKFIDSLIDEVTVGDVNQPETLHGCCEQVDYVVSSIGLTKKSKGLTFRDVDYKGNVHLLREAEKSGVEKMMYIHVFMNGKWKAPGSLIEAKENFVKELKASEVPYIIIRPTGYFSDMAQILRMARNGRVYLLGDGRAKMNPIHERDVAHFSTDALHKKNQTLDVGGPEVYTYKEIAQLAFTTQKKKARLTHVPVVILKVISYILKASTKHTYGVFQFLFNVMTHDLIAPKYGAVTLESFFEKESS